jgi:hypothetical protein
LSEIYNTWKGISTKMLISKEPMIGWIYKAKNKIGVLLSNEGNIVKLRDKNGDIHNVPKHTLKIIIAV